MKTAWHNLSGKANYVFILLLVCSAPFSGIVVSALIGTLFVLWILRSEYKTVPEKISDKNFILPVLLYLFFLIGMFYTENLDSGWFDLQVKLSILIFPLIFSGNTGYNAKQTTGILSGYIAGCLITCTVCCVISLQHTIESGINHFFYKDFSYFMHPGYFSMYLNMAVALIAGFFLKKSESTIRYKWLLILILLFFIFCIILLSSKSGIFSMIIILALFFSKYFFKSLKIALPAILTGLAVLIVLLFQFIPGNVNRFWDFERIIITGQISETNKESTQARIYIWKDAVELIKEHPVLGYGTGDVKDALVKKYRKENFSFAAEEKLNAHNQFLQTFIATGAVGFLLLILTLFFSLKLFLKNNSFVGISFMIIIFLNFMIESVLETQAGVVFYALFNSLFIFKFKDNAGR